MKLRFAALMVVALHVPSHAGEDVRAKLLAMPVSSQLGGEGTRPIASDKAFSLQMPNSPARHQRPFSFGNRLFNTNWVEAPSSVKAFDGLGPQFNRVSCAGCHTKDGRGQPPASGQGPMDSMLVRISLPGTAAHGGPNPHPVYGDQISERAITGLAPEARVEVSYAEQPGRYGDGEAYSLRKPLYRITALSLGPLGENVMLSPRVAPQVMGLGLLEAVPDETLLALADPDDSDGDGISGRVNRVWDEVKAAEVIGRFGWKANQPNLRQQNASAALGDIGLTTQGPDPDLSPEFLDKLTLYVATLAVPQQRGAGEVAEGPTLFRSMGCASCHMPTLVTNARAEPPETADQIIHPYTDLLLHDMGEGLADQRPDFAASGSEWRTPPLWGLGLVPTVNGHNTLLHDGRARGFAEAILWHGGEAETAKETFRNAPKLERNALIAFLNSL